MTSQIDGQTPTNVPGTQTIARALAVLRVLRTAESADGAGLGLGDVARAVDLRQSTTHRILSALCAHGYVSQDARRDRYRLGQEAFLLGSAAASSMGLDGVGSVIDQLVAETEESVNLVLLDGDVGVVAVRSESPLPLRFTQPPGSRLPLHATSSGKAILAFTASPEATVDGLGELPRLTGRTITSRQALLDELTAVRARGFAINREERYPGVCGVAAPVLDQGVATGALSIQGPEVRLPLDRLHEIGELAVATAERISSLLYPR